MGVLREGVIGLSRKKVVRYIADYDDYAYLRCTRGRRREAPGGRKDCILKDTDRAVDPAAAVASCDLYV